MDIMEIYHKDRYRFPIIGSVMCGNAQGKIYCNNSENVTHLFVIHKFGFCQELFTDYDEIFGGEIIKLIKESKGKLRLYAPGHRLEKFLDGYKNASLSKRIRYKFTYGSKAMWGGGAALTL